MIYLLISLHNRLNITGFFHILFDMRRLFRASSFQGGGEGGIRTHETVSRLHAFQACAIDHSATSPRRSCAARTIAGMGAETTRLNTHPQFYGIFTLSGGAPGMRVNPAGTVTE
jgi:hypothetical protein